MTVVQFADDLTLRQAAAMAARAIDRKYMLGREPADPGFGHTVLTRFRKRLLEHTGPSAPHSPYVTGTNRVTSADRASTHSPPDSRSL